MDLEIISIHNHGSIDRERVWIKVVDSCDLGYYAIADTTYVGNHKVSNRLRHFYWFPHHNVETGDYISLRTGKGIDKTFKNENGDTVHRFHWGLNVPVWNDDGDAAVLIFTSDWAYKVAK